MDPEQLAKVLLDAFAKQAPVHIRADGDLTQVQIEGLFDLIMVADEVMQAVAHRRKA